MCLYAKYLANMTQVSDVAPGPLVFKIVGVDFTVVSFVAIGISLST
jgi:hypothetical protein